MTVDLPDQSVPVGTLRIRTSRDSSTCTLVLAGELDLANADRLAAELEKAESERARRIVLDMSELEFIDSTGISILLLAHRRLNVGGEDCFRLVPSQAPGVCRVFALTGLDDAIPVVRS